MTTTEELLLKYAVLSIIVAVVLIFELRRAIKYHRKRIASRPAIQAGQIWSDYIKGNKKVIISVDQHKVYWRYVTESPGYAHMTYKDIFIRGNEDTKNKNDRVCDADIKKQFYVE